MASSRFALGCTVLAMLALLMGLAVRIGATAPPPPTLPPADYIPPKGYVGYRASAPPRIDGKLDDPAWAAAPWTDAFVDIEGNRKPAPRLRTRVKMLWDDRCLYIAAELEEPHVWGTLTKHDSVIFHDNDFEVFIDPDGDRHLYGELEMNALNTTWDLLLNKPYRDGGRPVDAWEITGLRTAVHVGGTLNDPSDTDRGWSLEIAWPWQSLKEIATCKVPPGDEDQWRINFSRVEWQHEIVDGKYRKVKGPKEANWVWSPQWAIDMHRPEQWGTLQFSTAAPGTAKFRPDPAGAAKHLLYRVYYAQKTYYQQHQRWARTLAELGGKFDGVQMDTTRHWFEASTTVGKGEHWYIGADGRMWKEE